MTATTSKLGADMKDHEIAQTVNQLRDIAKEYGQTQQLRERIAAVIVPILARQPAAIDKQEAVRALFQPWPEGELGATDEPESQYRLGYNTAIEDALEVLAAPLANEASKPAPSPLSEISSKSIDADCAQVVDDKFFDLIANVAPLVEQGERGAQSQMWVIHERDLLHVMSVAIGAAYVSVEDAAKRLNLKSVARAASTSANVAQGAEAVAQSDARYIVIGYGETDYPQAAFVNEREQLLDAVLGMMYTEASDADEETRDAYAKDLADDDEWSSDGIWSTEFEIGGITIYDLGYGAALTAAQSASGDQS